MTRWDVEKDGAWWTAPPSEQRWAYYMTLRVHYEMPAAEALRAVNQNSEVLGVGRPLGFIGVLREHLGGGA